MKKRPPRLSEPGGPASMVIEEASSSDRSSGTSPGTWIVRRWADSTASEGFAKEQEAKKGRATLEELRFIALAGMLHTKGREREEKVGNTVKRQQKKLIKSSSRRE
jgi:hypothetical protein